MNPDKKNFISQVIDHKKTTRMCNALIHDNHYKYKHRGKAWDWSIYPITNPYYSPFNAINLFEVEELDFISNFPFVLIRDGLFSFMHFFLKHKEPPRDLRTKFIVHESFAPTIPFSWKKNIWYFNYYISPNTFHYKEIQKKALIVKGYLLRSYLSLEHFESELKKIKIFLESNKRELFLCFPVCHDFFLQKHCAEKDHLYNMLKIIYDVMDKEQINIIHTTDIEKINNYNEVTFIDTNQFLKCYCDDYLNHSLMANGCLPEPHFIKDRPLNEEDNEDLSFYRLSPNHGIVIHEKHPQSFSSLRQDIEEANQFVDLKNLRNPVDTSFFYHLNRIFQKHIPPFEWQGDPNIKNENSFKRPQAKEGV